MIRLYCDGVECNKWVDRDVAAQVGWIQVVSYPISDPAQTAERKALCLVCSRRYRQVFK